MSHSPGMAFKGTCQVFTLGLNDGTVHTALFDYVN